MDGRPLRSLKFPLPYGGEMASPLMSLGSGFLRAVFAAFDTRGAPWIMRGSFMRLVSNLAGAKRRRYQHV